MEKQTLANELQRSKNVRIGFSTIIGLFWMAMASSAYNVLLLDSQQFTSAQVGVIMAIYSSIGIIAPPIWGYLADKMHSIPKAYLIVYAIHAVIIGFMPVFGMLKFWGFSFLAVALPLSNFVRTPSMSLMDAWTIHSVTHVRRVSFGMVRLWGSIGWAVACVSLSFLADALGIYAVFISCGIMSVVVCLYSIRLNRKVPMVEDDDAQDAPKAEEKQKINPALLFKNYYFVVLLVFHFLIQMMGNSSMLFLPYVFRSIGVDPNISGAATGIKALMEVPFLLAGGYLLTRFKLPPMIAAVGCIYAFEHFLYTMLGTPLLAPFVQALGSWSVISIQLFGGLASGLYLTTSVQYAYRLAPKELTASAQSFLGMSMSLGAICASLLGGMIIQASGVRAFYTLTSSTMLVGIVLFLLSFPFGEKVLKIPRPAAAKSPRE